MSLFGLQGYLSNFSTYFSGSSSVESREMVISQQNTGQSSLPDNQDDDLGILDEDQSTSESESSKSSGTVSKVNPSDSDSDTEGSTSIGTDIPLPAKDGEITETGICPLQQLELYRKALEANKKFKQEIDDNVKKTADLKSEVVDLKSEVDTQKADKLSALKQVKELNDKAAAKDEKILELMDIIQNIKTILVEIRNNNHILKYQNDIQARQVKNALNPSFGDRFYYLIWPESVVNKANITYTDKRYLLCPTLSQQEIEDRIHRINQLINKKNILQQSIKDSCQINPFKWEDVDKNF